MHIILKRHRVGPVACDGYLSIDGMKICDTAENACFRPPAGTYRVVLRTSSIHKRRVPYLEPLDDRTASLYKGGVKPCLCIGNGIYNRHDRRICLGTYVAPGCLKWSRPNFLPLYQRINMSLRRGNNAELTIIETTDTE